MPRTEQTAYPFNAKLFDIEMCVTTFFEQKPTAVEQELLAARIEICAREIQAIVKANRQRLETPA